MSLMDSSTINTPVYKEEILFLFLSLFLYIIFHVQGYDKGYTNSRYYANTGEHPCYTKKLIK